jgi:hypothetical protein
MKRMERIDDLNQVFTKRQPCYALTQFDAFRSEGISL